LEPITLNRFPITPAYRHHKCTGLLDKLCSARYQAGDGFGYRFFFVFHGL
jgi:hypothetical protein